MHTGEMEVVGDEIGNVAWGQEESGLKNQSKKLEFHQIVKGKTSKVF